jgi:hypothetical protein
MRSAVEEQLNLIAHGKANFQAVLKHTVEIFRLKFQYFVKNIDGMDQLFEVSFSPLSASGKAHSRLGEFDTFISLIMLGLQVWQVPEIYEIHSGEATQIALSPVRRDLQSASKRHG